MGMQCLQGLQDAQPSSSLSPIWIPSPPNFQWLEKVISLYARWLLQSALCTCGSRGRSIARTSGLHLLYLLFHSDHTDSILAYCWRCGPPSSAGTLDMLKITVAALQAIKNPFIWVPETVGARFPALPCCYCSSFPGGLKCTSTSLARPT